MPMALVVPADPSQPVEYKRLEGTLPELNDLVDGYVQFLWVEGTEFVLNEDGKAIGLPVNPRASMCLYQLDPRYIGHDFFVGDVVVLGESDGEGSFADVTDEAKKCFGL